MTAGHGLMKEILVQIKKNNGSPYDWMLPDSMLPIIELFSRPVKEY